MEIDCLYVRMCKLYSIDIYKCFYSYNLYGMDTKSINITKIIKRMLLDILFNGIKSTLQ